MSTKKLATELGLLRQRSQSSSAPGNVFLTNQIFSHLIIIDFESTCWKEKNDCSQEIIEFPAVLLNTSSGQIQSEFHTYVQPQEHPALSAFCTELTGITQDQVEAGVPLHICLSRFCRWLKKLELELELEFPSMQQQKCSTLSASKKLCAFVTWSDWDLGVCLLYECRRKQLHKPVMLSSWIDLRKTYRLFYNRKPKGLKGALQDLGVQFSGREHSGLDDARNTAKLAVRMMRDGCVMKITKSLERTLTEVRVENPDNHRGNPQRNNKESPRLSFGGSVQSLVSPRTLLPSNPQWAHCRHSQTSIACNDVDRSLVLCSTTLACLSYLPERVDAEEPSVEMEGRCSSYDDVVLGTEVDVKDADGDPSSDCDGQGHLETEPKNGPSEVGNRVKKCRTEQFTKAPAGGLCFAVPQSFSIPIPGKKTAARATVKSRQNPWTSFTVYAEPVGRALASRTPLRPANKVLSSLCANIQPLYVTESAKRAQKVTSPLCACGRRAKRQVVSKGGPNQGRGFFCCPTRRSVGGGEIQKGCGFFKWESSVIKSTGLGPPAAVALASRSCNNSTFSREG